MLVNMSDVKTFILKQKNNTYDVNNFLCGSTNVWTQGESAYLTFTLLEDDTYSVKATNPDNVRGELIIPSTYNDKPVTVIAENAFKGSHIAKLTIPDSIKTIGANAFKNGIVTELSIDIPDGVTSIGEKAFYDNPSDWNNMYIPASVTTLGSNIGRYVFYCEAESKPSGWSDDWFDEFMPYYWGVNRNCFNENHNYGNWIIDNEASYESSGMKHRICSDCGKTETEAIPRIVTAESYFTFTEQIDGTYSIKAADVSNLPSEVGIPFTYNGKAVTAIDENAFYSATINKVVIPEGVTRIGNGAFDNCKRLLNVSLPSTLTEIGGWAFRDCTALTSIVIPIGVTTIGTWAFLRDMSLTINCEASSQPSGWHTDWNLSGGTVVWGYTG